jgi:predicted transcriptional regulator
MNITPELLQSLNLSSSEAAVYLAALELGESSILEIARESGVKRSSIYNFLEELKSRGLIIETKKKKRAVFSAAPPRSLVEIENTRLKDLQRLLPELEAVENKSRTKPRVTFHEGIEGIKHAYTDSFKAKGSILGFSDFDAGLKVMGYDYYTDYYEPERARRKLYYRAIVRDSAETREYIKDDNRYWRESKILPGEGVSTEINIYNDTVCLNSFRAKKPFAVLIEDKDLAQSLRYVWQQLWDRLG